MPPISICDLTDPVEIRERDASTALIFEKGRERERRYLPGEPGTDLCAALLIGGR